MQLETCFFFQQCCLRKSHLEHLLHFVNCDVIKTKGPARMFLKGGKKEVHSIESQKSSQRSRMQDYHIYTAEPIVCTLYNHVSGPSGVEPTDDKTQNLLKSLQYRIERDRPISSTQTIHFSAVNSTIDKCRRRPHVSRCGNPIAPCLSGEFTVN